MQSIRPLVQSSCQALRSTTRTLQRRHASHGHGPSGPSHHVNEGLGTATYLTFAFVPVGYLFYLFTTATDAPITRLIHFYEESREALSRRNARHAEMLDRAASDRALFAGEANQPGSTMKGIRFSEIFNTGSPYNVPAGHGAINLDKVMEKYWKDNEDMEEKKQMRMEKKRQGQVSLDSTGKPEDPSTLRTTPAA